jgi:uncharacterized protein YajQ (UPF0234 family)
MAAQPSFDITSEVDLAEVDNAINQAKKEIGQRYDFKGSKASIEFKTAENAIVLVADNNMQIEAVREILFTRLVRRNVPIKNLTPSEIETVGGGLSKQTITLQQGIPSDAAKKIVQFLKEHKLRKVQAAIQGDQLRISSASKDELQHTIALLRGEDFGVELRFGNYRG